MRYERLLQGENGDVVNLVTMVSANVFVELGYEIEQFALVKHADSEEWTPYYHQCSNKSISRKEYMENHKPNTLLGVVSIGEALKAGIEAKEQFFTE